MENKENVVGYAVFHHLINYSSSKRISVKFFYDESYKNPKWEHSEDYPYYDSIRFVGKNIQIKMNPEHMIFYDMMDVNGIRLGDSVSLILHMIGNPDSIKIVYDDVCDCDKTLYYYFGNYLSIIDDELVGFKIVNSKLKMKQLNIRVGDNCNKIGKYHVQPCSGPIFSSSDIDYGIFIKDEKGLMMDDYLHISLKNHKIEEIYFTPFVP